MIKDILKQTICNNQISDYIISLLVFVLGVALIVIIRKVVLKRLKTWAQKTATTLDDFLIQIFRKALIPILYFGMFYLSTRNLRMNPSISKVIDVLGAIILTCGLINNVNPISSNNELVNRRICRRFFNFIIKLIDSVNNFD